MVRRWAAGTPMRPGDPEGRRQQNAAAATWSTLGWCIIAVLMIAYGYYLRRIGKISRRMQEQMGSANS